MNEQTNLGRECLQLIHTIHQLMRQAPDGWVSWRKAAKEQEGSEEWAEALSAAAQLPQNRGYFIFANNGRVVKLSEKGLTLVQTTTITYATEPERIAQTVKQYASRLQQQRLTVMGIARVACVGHRYVQAVQVNLGDGIVPADSPVTFRSRAEGTMVHGRVVGQEADGSTLYVALDQQIYEYQLPATLAIDRAYLLHQLAVSIAQMPAIPPLGQQLLQKQAERSLPITHTNSRHVGQMLAALRPPWARFLWGPPGAGKTFALGQLVLQLLQHNAQSRILLVAPSNLAVDVAMGQVVRLLENSPMQHLLSQRQMLRYGYPRHPEILAREELLGPPALKQLSYAIQQLSQKLTQLRAREAAEAEMATARAEMLAAQEELKAAVVSHIGNARLVATTTTLAYMPTSPIHQQMWSTVLVDEATMVPPAVCLFLSALAEERLLLAGDPRQLGPVYEERRGHPAHADNWMGQDIFTTARLSIGSGVSRQVDITDRRMARITSQRRCAAAIWQRVETLYPEVQILTDAASVQRLAALPPRPGQGIVLLDVGDAERTAVCEQVHQSWQNSYTAHLALEIAGAIVAETDAQALSIAIITPYRAQVRLLSQILREEQRAGSRLGNSLDVGTIHQFQGSEADVVIFDMVDGYGRPGLGKLLRDDTGLRLVNVAVTRARGKVIILADRAWYRQHVDRGDNPLLWNLVIEQIPAAHMKVIPPRADTAHPLVESPIENLLLTAMQRIPILQDVQIQHLIRNENDTIISRADFAFPTHRHAVYCDGAQWHVRQDRWQRDLRQRNKLTELGWRFSVFSGRDIHADADACARQIAHTLFPNRRLEFSTTPTARPGNEAPNPAPANTARSIMAVAPSAVELPSPPLQTGTVTWDKDQVTASAIRSLPPGLCVALPTKGAKSAVNRILHGMGLQRIEGEGFADWQDDHMLVRVYHERRPGITSRYALERLR